jgi:periplasmic copper chaperone A
MVFLLLLAGACTAREAGVVTAGDVKVHGAFSFAPPTQSEAAGYFTVVNSGRQPDTLLSVTSPIAAGAMLHGQVQDGGMVRMTHLEAPVVPAGDSLVLQPGGTHLMLMTLDRLPRPGDSVPVTLTFSRAGTMSVMLPVRAYGDAP